MTDVPDDGLSARMYMHMLDRDVLVALAPLPRQGFHLHGVRAHKFVCQVTEHVEPFDAVTLVRVACDNATRTGNQFEQRNIGYSHVRCQHRLDFIFRLYSSNDGQSGIERDLIRTPRTKTVVLAMVRGRMP